MIEIVKAPPFATVQDLGRPGHRHEGVAPAGAMDPVALIRLNRSLGNPVTAAGIEWALGPGTFMLPSGGTIAMGPAAGWVDGRAVSAWTAVQCPPGAEVAVEPPSLTRFSYFAIAGGVDAVPVLGSRSTYLPGGFGGHGGRRLQSGDRLLLGPAPTASPSTPLEPPPRYGTEIRVVRGPQAHLFDGAAWATLLDGHYAVASASDRMGYRLEGPVLRHAGLAAMPSEAACPGAIQVPDGGAPIVLMPDGPTVGGYPKIAVVISADLGQLAQLRPGDRPVFQLVPLGAVMGPEPAR